MDRGNLLGMEAGRSVGRLLAQIRLPTAKFMRKAGGRAADIAANAFGQWPRISLL